MEGYVEKTVTIHLKLEFEEAKMLKRLVQNIPNLHDEAQEDREFRMKLFNFLKEQTTSETRQQ